MAAPSGILRRGGRLMIARPVFARLVSAFCLMTGLALAQNAGAADALLVPKIEGPWWQVADSPDLGQYTTDRQQPVDFAIWQAADGTWQIWSCIRATAYPGWTRLLYRWEAKDLTDHDWKPMGIVMTSDTGLGEVEGMLQAPYVMRAQGKYVMFYGTGDQIALA